MRKTQQQDIKSVCKVQATLTWINSTSCIHCEAKLNRMSTDKANSDYNEQSTNPEKKLAQNLDL